ncbi:MAG: choice-of-anchor Q domain-containing protein, partial [Vulcanimicrobiaceae bacterium]
ISDFYFYNSTIYQNSATNYGGNLYDFTNTSPGAGSDLILARNSIVAGGVAGNADSSDIYNGDYLQDLDYNLFQNVTHNSPGQHYCSGVQNDNPCTHDITGVSPLIASSLANNGGSTLTLADSSTSPGKGYVPFASGLCNNAPGTNVDQRGYTRGAGGVCDVGAYEFAGTAP